MMRRCLLANGADAVNVSLTPKLEAFIRRKVASGLYNNASEVIREALRLLVERERAEVVAKPSPSAAELRLTIAKLERPLRTRGIASLALFGSVIRGTAREDSDIDVLIDVDPKTRFSLVDLVAVKNLLEERLGRSVDVVTREGLEPTIRDRVLGQAERIF